MTQGRFQIQRVLGAGAHAVVVLCTDRQAGGTVALKVLRDTALNDKNAVDRLRDEGRILSKLTHRNVAGCYEVLDFSGRPVLVMEAVHGVSLAHLLRVGGPLPGRVCLEIAASVANALDHAWTSRGVDGREMQVVHRDVTPGNVLLSVAGVPKLIDFGVAKGSFRGRQAQSLFLVQSSSGYQAPERAVTVHDGPSVDVYGLCATLFTLLTGHVPLLSKNATAHERGLDKHLAQLPDVEGVQGSELALLIRQMAAWDPEERPEMGEVAARLRALTGGAFDLVAYAREAVAPILDTAQKADAIPRDEVLFLERQNPDDPLTPLGDVVVTRRLRALMRKGHWEKRIPEIQRLLARGDRFVAKPLLEVLDRAEVAWYQPFRRTARPGELEAALLLLCDHADAEVLRRAHALQEYPDQRVQAAVRFVLAQSGRDGP